MSGLIVRKILIFLFFCGVVVNIEAVAPVAVDCRKLTVDIAQVLSDVSVNPVGLNSCWLLNSDQWRPDAVPPFKDAVRSMHLGSLRFPYGALGEFYLWHSGDYADAVNGLEPRAICDFPEGRDWSAFIKPDGSFVNGMDFDEFLDICQGVNAEPVVMIPVTTCKLQGVLSREQLKENAVEWVRYANKVRDYKITYWEIGNEVDQKWKDWMPDYIDLYVEFSQAMKEVDPKIKTGFASHQSKEWFDAAMQQIPEHVDFLVAHPYMNDFGTYEDYLADDGSRLLIPRVEDAVNAIRQYAPPEEAERIKVLVTEASSFSYARAWENDENNILKSMVYFEMLGNMLNIPEVEYVHFWTSHSPWTPFGSRDDAKALFDDNSISPMGCVSKVWGTFIQDEMVQVAPRATGPVRAYASSSFDRKNLSLYLLNKGKTVQEITVRLENGVPVPEGTLWSVSGTAHAATDTEYTWLSRGAISITNSTFTVLVLPCSMNVVSFGK